MVLIVLVKCFLLHKILIYDTRIPLVYKKLNNTMVEREREREREYFFKKKRLGKWSVIVFLLLSSVKFGL